MYSIENERYLTDSVEERKGKDTYIQVIDKLGKYGSINIKAELIIPTIYENIEPFYKDKAIAKKDGKYGLINNKNEIIIEFKYKYIKRYDDHYTAELDNNLYGLYNSDGKEIFPKEYQGIFISRPVNRRILLEKNNLWAIFDYDGVQITDFLFGEIERVWDKKHGLFSISIAGKFGVNDIHSENIIDVQISPRKCGLYNIKEKCFVGKFQRIDLLMDNELISVSKGKNENGIVNQLGEVIIPFEYYDTVYFPIVAKDKYS